MSQATDRLGQPLSVGDWCIADNCQRDPEANGHQFKITHFDDDNAPICTDMAPPGFAGKSGVFGFASDCVRKINPKPKTTTWDQCEWQPEGVSA